MAPGESFDQALLREVREETGFTITLDRVAGVTEFELPHAHVVMLYMRARVLEGKLQLSSEHSEIAWVGWDELHMRNLTPPLRGLICRMLVHPCTSSGEGQAPPPPPAPGGKTVQPLRSPLAQ